VAGLPDFVPPMLCQRGEAFDDAGWLFEVKWDGTRAQVAVENGRWRLRNRRDRDLTSTYPELESLRALPEGTLLDGEVVVFDAGQPSFTRMLQREQARTEPRARELARHMPAVFVAFDCLFSDGISRLREPLAERRERLDAIAQAALPRLQASEGVVGQGSAMFAAVREQGLEGMVAKRLDRPYFPGQRSPDWLKVKAVHRILCAIVGWQEDAAGGLRSLVIATDDADGILRLVGKVGSGLRAVDREELFKALRENPKTEPCLWVEDTERRALQSGGRVHWVEPVLFCRVSYLERSRTGALRGPVFEQWIREADPGGGS